MSKRDGGNGLEHRYEAPDREEREELKRLQTLDPFFEDGLGRRRRARAPKILRLTPAMLREAA